MKRKVLIIINPGEDEKADNYCKGVFVDADNYKSYFMTPYGGNWKEPEIAILDRPTKANVKLELDKMSLLDFSIVIFCGHGFYSSISKSNILELNSMEHIDSVDLKRGADKRIIILDCCRKIHAEYINEAVIEKAKTFSETMGGLLLNPLECEKYYNKTIMECEGQIIICNGADIDEFADDDSSKGGLYSSNLLKFSREYVGKKLETIDLKSKYKCESIVAVQNGVSPLVAVASGNKQHPQIQKPRSAQKYLPFIVIA